jgi:hypothetical protein
MVDACWELCPKCEQSLLAHGSENICLWTGTTSRHSACRIRDLRTSRARVFGQAIEGSLGCARADSKLARDALPGSAWRAQTGNLCRVHHQESSHPLAHLGPRRWAPCSHWFMGQCEINSKQIHSGKRRPENLRHKSAAV